MSAIAVPHEDLRTQAQQEVFELKARFEEVAEGIAVEIEEARMQIGVAFALYVPVLVVNRVLRIIMQGIAVEAEQIFSKLIGNTEALQKEVASFSNAIQSKVTAVLDSLKDAVPESKDRFHLPMIQGYRMYKRWKSLPKLHAAADALQGAFDQAKVENKIEQDAELNPPEEKYFTLGPKEIWKGTVDYTKDLPNRVRKGWKKAKKWYKKGVSFIGGLFGRKKKKIKKEKSPDTTVEDTVPAIMAATGPDSTAAQKTAVLAQEAAEESAAQTSRALAA